MYKKRSTRPRRPARRPRRARKSRVPRSLALKTYDYVFKLPPQIVKDNIPGQAFGLSNAAGAGLRPLTNTKINPLGPTNGLSNYMDITFATSFMLADIANFTQFTALYDAYCITKVVCHVEALSNVAVVNGTGLMPSLYHYWDNDDAVVPPTVGSLYGKQGVKRRQFGNRSQTTYACSGTPKPLTDSANLVSFINVGKKQWIDCVDTTAEHYGLKMALTDVYYPPPVPGASITAFRFNWTYHVSFRAPLTTT